MSNQGFDMAQKRQEINPEALLEGLTEIGGVLTTKDALSAGMERLNELSETEIAILLRLNNDELKANFFKKKFLLGPISPIPDEASNSSLQSSAPFITQRATALSTSESLIRNGRQHSSARSRACGPT